MNNNKDWFETHDGSIPKDGVYIWRPDEYSDDPSEKEIIIIRKGICKTKQGKKRIIFGGQWFYLTNSFEE